MKIAVISDIHGNMPALETVTEDLERWRPDAVIVDGDIVNRGPCSLAAWQFVQKQVKDNAWQVVKGNHEEYVLDCATPAQEFDPPTIKIRQYAQWTYEQLNDQIADIAALPDQVSINGPDDSEFRVVHGSMRNNRDGVYPKTTDKELREQIAPAPSVFVTGHTHRPLMRQVDKTLVVNVGAVGAPFDGDPRLSYGRFTFTQSHGWQGEIKRLAYDTAQTERDYVSSGFLEHGGPLAQLMLVEHRRSGGLIYRWASRYQEAVINHELTLEESVRNVLRDEDLRPFLGPPGWNITS